MLFVCVCVACSLVYDCALSLLCFCLCSCSLSCICYCFGVSFGGFGVRLICFVCWCLFARGSLVVFCVVLCVIVCVSCCCCLSFGGGRLCLSFVYGRLRCRCGGRVLYVYMCYYVWCLFDCIGIV